MRIAIQGEQGSFSHEAALRMDPQAIIVPCGFSSEVFQFVENEEDSAAVIPIENSLAGSVLEHFDLLLHHDVQIEREFILRIHHNVIAVPGAELKNIDRIFSHPVALAQCRRFFAEHPKVMAIPFYDTAGSVKHIIKLGDPGAAAIASDRAASFYGGEVIVAGMEDNPANFTRFFLLRNSRNVRQNRDPNKVSIAFSVKNQPGSLVSALQAFAANKTNLSKIESRPVQGQPWQYIFYVDSQISDRESAQAALEELRRSCLMVKEFGFYSAAASNPD